MGIKHETVEIETKYCDYCGEEELENPVYGENKIFVCEMCKKDFCLKCGYDFLGDVYSANKDKILRSINILTATHLCLCKECVDKIKNEGEKNGTNN